MSKSSKLKNIIRGDTLTLNLAFTNSSGTPYDLTGCEIFFTVKPVTDPSITSESNTADDTTSVITTSVSNVANPTLGLATLTLTSSQMTVAPATYYYDIQLVSAGGAVTSTIYDTITIIPDITRRVI